MIVLVYNPDTERMERHLLGLDESMPYTYDQTLTVGEFMGSTQGSILWTDKRTMDTWTAFRSYWGRPIFVGYAFKRIWEGGHAGQSQHYAGMSFDTGQNLTRAGRVALHSAAVNFGRWTYVEPLALTPTWVHFDRRLVPPACSTGGYPLQREGSRGVYTLVLQDALNALGYTGSNLDGYFGPATERSVRRFQSAVGLSADGIVGCNTWRALTSRANGIGRTPTVIDG
nr:peptidoglycan-binding domain-containing protein [bacterium]